MAEEKSKDIRQTNKQKFTNEELKRLQSLPLDEKIAVSLTRIAEFQEKMDHKTYISFSGGKDSTVLLHLVRRLYPDTPAVYIDTGLEYPEVKQFAKSQENVIVVRPKLSFRQVIEKYGYPIISKEQSRYIREYRNTKSEKLKLMRIEGNKWGMGKIAKKWLFLINAPFLIDDNCCNVMKKRPAKQFEKESGLHPIIGTMASESRQRKSKWLETGCNAFDGDRPNSRPLSFWTEQDVLAYLKKYNLHYASVYGEIVYDDNDNLCTTGCQRTGCVFCGYGAHLEKEPNRFQRLKETHPKLWSYCMKPWDQGGLGMREVLELIGVNVD